MCASGVEIVTERLASVQPAPEAVVAKRQISLWTEKEKTAFMEAYKVVSCPLRFRHQHCSTKCLPMACGCNPLHAASQCGSLLDQPAVI